MAHGTIQHEFLDQVLPRIAADGRVAGIAVGGSLASGASDQYSDVDLVLAIHDDQYESVMVDRLGLIASWSAPAVAFTGEHVGEPRLIIALMGPPVLHVDFKFVRASDFTERVSDPLLLWDPTGALARELAANPLEDAPLDLQWIEDRFWVWVHYGATKLGRGELFQVLDTLSFLRSVVFGPLAALRAGVEPRGVRQLERVAPEEAAELRATVCGYDVDEASEALLAAVALYRRWIAEHNVDRRHAAEKLATDYLAEIVGR
ncbi:MAG: hypothetical protein AAGC66_12470 [Leifsonia sp.]